MPLDMTPRRSDWRAALRLAYPEPTEAERAEALRTFAPELARLTRLHTQGEAH